MIECMTCAKEWTGTGDEAIAAGWSCHHYLATAAPLYTSAPWECPSCEDANSGRYDDPPYNFTDAYNARQEHLAELGDRDRDDRKDDEIQEAHRNAPEAPPNPSGANP